MKSEEYASKAGEFFHPSARTPLGLYAPVAAKVLELSVYVREADDDRKVFELIGETLRFLLVPGAMLGATAPTVDYRSVDLVWDTVSDKGRHLGAMRELHLLAARYVTQAALIPTDPGTRARRLYAMGRDVRTMIEHLATLLAIHGCTPGEAAAHDLQRLGGLAGSPAPV